MVGPRHDRPAAGLFHSRRRSSRRRWRPRPGRACRLRAPQHLDDHRQARDIGQRLAGQPGRGHAGRDEDENVVGHGWPRYTGCQRRGKTDVFVRRHTGCHCGGKPVSTAVPRRSRSAMDSFELNKIMGAVLGTCLALLSLNIAAGAIFSRRMAGQAGLRDRGPRRKPRGQAGRPAAAEESLPVGCLPRPSAAGQATAKNASPATPSARAGRTGSAPISMAWSAAPRRRRRASTIRRR